MSAKLTERDLDKHIADMLEELGVCRHCRCCSRRIGSAGWVLECGAVVKPRKIDPSAVQPSRHEALAAIGRAGRAL